MNIENIINDTFVEVFTENKPITIGEWSQISFGSVVSKSISAKKLFQQYRKDIILPTFNKS